MFICGSKNLQHLEGENELCNSPCRTPKRSKFSSFFKHKEKSSKVNPYADVGLDRFNRLVAEHENRKQQIYKELGTESISLVRFAYSDDSNEMKPVVVRNLDRSKRTNDSPRISSSYYKDQCVIPKSEGLVVHVPEQEEVLVEKKKKGRSLRTCDGRFRLDNLGLRSCYFLAFLATILLLLAISGRVFAIFWMTIGWYMVPATVPESPVRRNPKRKKVSIVHSQRLSSPRTVVTTSGLLTEYKDQEQHVCSRRRSWS